MVASLNVVAPVIPGKAVLNLTCIGSGGEGTSPTREADLQVMICTGLYSLQYDKLGRDVRTTHCGIVAPVTFHLVAVCCVPVTDLDLIERNAGIARIEQH